MRRVVFFVLVGIFLGIGTLGYSNFKDPKSSNGVYGYYKKQIRWNYQKKKGVIESYPSKFIDWTHLNFYVKETHKIALKKNESFISKPLEEVNSLKENMIQTIYHDLLNVPIDSNLKIKNLILMNTEFKNLLFDSLYSLDTDSLISRGGETVFLENTLPFKGAKGLISLIFKSHYYSNQKPLKPIENSIYASNYYKRLVIDARGLKFQPNLFPKIYSYDEKGKLILIYSVENSDTASIIKNGYVTYFNNEQALKLSKQDFYISALDINGDYGNNLVISREDYVKFFLSANSLTSLSKGFFTIVSESSYYIE